MRAWRDGGETSAGPRTMVNMVRLPRLPGTGRRSAPVAQRTEQEPSKLLVAGSIPAGGTTVEQRRCKAVSSMLVSRNIKHDANRAIVRHVMQQRGRQRTQGAIDELPSGSLRVRVFAGYDSVTRRRNYLTEHIPAGPDALREAEKARTRLLNDVNERRHPRTNVTMDHLLREYLEVANLDPGTLRGYERNYRIHVKPFIGATKIGAVDAHLLESLYAELRRCRRHCNGRRHVEHRTERPHTCDHRCRLHECTPLSASVTRRIHFLLSGAFKRALRWGWVSTNPVRAAEPPPEPKPDPQPPTPEEATRIVNAAWEDPDWGTFVWLAMTTGTRRAELCALRWRHVNLTSGTLTVRRSIDQSGAELREKETKTHQHRRIALDPDTTAALSELRSRSAERASSVGCELSDDSFVFSPAPDGSAPLKPDSVTHRYRRLADRLGMRTTIHKLRHFSATELIAAGVDPRTVSGRLGHAGGGSTTLRAYSAWVSESDQRAAAVLSSRMPTRPTGVLSRTERAKTDPQSPYERIAAELRQLILSGRIAAGTHLPTTKEIAASRHVSTGTAHRAVAMLQAWGLIEVSRGHRAVVRSVEMEPANDLPGVVRPSTPLERRELLDLQILRGNQVIRRLRTEANPNSATELRTLLLDAIGRAGEADSEIGGYEMNVRYAGERGLLTTFVLLKR